MGYWDAGGWSWVGGIGMQAGGAGWGGGYWDVGGWIWVGRQVGTGQAGFWAVGGWT